MGKRKATRKPPKKVRQRLEVTFTCLFCNHEKSVICTLDKKNSLGELHCKVCGQSFQAAINSLSQPVDIYSDWIDACEDIAEEAESKGAFGALENEKEDKGSEDEFGETRKTRNQVLSSDEE